MIKDIMTANESIAPNSREMEILKEHLLLPLVHLKGMRLQNL